MKISIDINVVMDVHTETKLPTSGSGWYGLFYSFPWAKDKILFNYVPYSDKWKQFWNFDHMRKRNAGESEIDLADIKGWVKCERPQTIFADYAVEAFNSKKEE